LRFDQKEIESRGRLWQILCEDFLQKFIKKEDIVMDIGAGYCEFLNNISCKKKIAVDINPDTSEFANKDVVVLKVRVNAIPKKFDGKVNVIFMSNFLEHLDSREEVLMVLNRANHILKKDGKLILIQPNIDLVKNSYWDFMDHKVVLNTRSIKEALDITGFNVEIFTKRFLPYTTKRNYVPMRHLLLKLYLKFPPFLRPYVGESFVVARKK